MMHSIVNNTAPEYMTSRFVRRCKYKLAVPQPRFEFYKANLSDSESVLWNSLTRDVQQLTSPNSFKGKLRDLNFDCQIIFGKIPILWVFETDVFVAQKGLCAI